MRKHKVFRKQRVKIIAGRNILYVAGGRMKWLYRNDGVVWRLISGINSSELISQKQTWKERLFISHVRSSKNIHKTGRSIIR